MHDQPTAHEASAHRLVSWRNLCMTMMLIAVFLYQFSYTLADTDLWGSIKFGQDIWRTGQIRQPDLYSYLSEIDPWLNHEWLAEAVFAYVYESTGASGLIAFKVVVALLIVGLIFDHLRRQGLTALRAWSLLLVGGLLLVIGLATIRAQMFTYLLFLLVLLIIYQADHGRVHYLWALPPIFALWVNLHGGFLAGMGLFLLWTLAYLITDLLQTRRPAALLSRTNLTVILTVVVSLCATLLNPYGIDLILFLLRTATVPRPEIAEWHPLNIWSRVGILYVVTVLVAVGGVLLSRRKRKPALMFLLAVMILLPLLAIRHVPLFALATLVLAGEHIGDVWQQLSASRLKGDSTRRNKKLEVVLSGLFLLVAAGFAVASRSHWGCIRFYPLAYPYQAVELLKTSGIRGNMAVHFDWGHYNIWHVGPNIQVSVDGRRETVYDQEAYGKNLAFFSGMGDWDAILTEHATDLALMKQQSPPHNLMALNSEWLVVYEDAISAIAVRTESPLIEQIRGVEPPPAPQGEYLCFP